MQAQVTQCFNAWRTNVQHTHTITNHIILWGHIYLNEEL